ncbi:uncharacterized protein DDB_G0272420-like [Clytia hemisphaerica]|uniref:uncharacterized protein DDB_G0272420-like n=1 Tax=Clytia hemisphaerica TaxID=252671 RepID=UPI0034D5FE93
MVYGSMKYQCQCHDIRSECFQNSDCPKMFICEIGRCIMISTEKQIIAKQTCSNLKSRCALDSDCSCAERSMVCINTECVYSDFHNRPMPVMCQQHSDCNIPYLCKGSTCKEAKSFEELMILTAAYDSCSGSDGCPQNHGCMQATHKCVALDVMPKAKFYKRNEECIYNSDCAKGLTCNGNICTKDLSLVSRLTCTKHSDCQIPQYCSKRGHCREAETLSHLHLLTDSYSHCSSNNDCPSAYGCDRMAKCVLSTVDSNSLQKTDLCISNGDCGTHEVCKNLRCVKSLPAVHLAFCLVNAYKSICLDDSDCPSCKSIQFHCKMHKCSYK